MNERTVFALIGGDELQSALAEKLIRGGYFVLTVGLENAPLSRLAEKTALATAICHSDNIVFPFDPCDTDGAIFAPFSAEKISLTKEILPYLIQRPVFCGTIYSVPDFFPRDQLYPYGKEGDFRVGKAILHTEGILRAAISQSKIALHHSSCLILGYDLEGEILARALLSLGARVTVVTDSLEQLARAAQSGAVALPFSRLAHAGQQQLIFRTIPFLLCTFDLERIGEEAIFLDLFPDSPDLSLILSQTIPYTSCADLWRTTAVSSVGSLIHDVILRMRRSIQ